MTVHLGQADVKAEDMMWLALWCASGALVGWVIGTFTGRPGIGTILGTFAGPFGWLILLGAHPRKDAVGAPPDVPAPNRPVMAMVVDDVQTIDASAPQPISWAASAPVESVERHATVARRVEHGPTVYARDASAGAGVSSLSSSSVDG